MCAHRVVDITVGASAENLVVRGTQLFVAVESGTQLAVIDTTTNTVSGHIDIGKSPYWLTVAETTSATGSAEPKLYAVSSDMSISVVSIAQPGFPAVTFPLDHYGGRQIVIGRLADSRRGTLYALDQGTAPRLLVLDTQTNTITGAIELGQRTAWSMVVSADGSRVYVTHPSDKVISVVDVTVTPPSVTAVPVAQYPSDVFLSPRGDRLYMTHWISQVAGLFRVIDLTTMLAGSVNTGLRSLSVIGDDSRAYVASFGANCVQVLDATTVPPRLLETIPINGSPGYLAMSDDGKTLYTNDFNGTAVHAVSLAAS